jgi:hypothetical protein
MSLLGNAVLVNWGGVVDAKESDYNSWHSKEHMPERIALPGFLRGCRAIGISGTEIKHKYFMMYEAERKEAFVSKKYLERLNNPTKWTKEILSNYIAPSRTICSVIASKSVGFGGCIASIRFLSKDIETKINTESLKLSVPQIIKLVGITGMHVLLGDSSFGQMQTEEKLFRSTQGMKDQIISQAILIEGTDLNSIQRSVSILKDEYSINESDNLIINYYQCQHIITKQDLTGI